MRTVAKVHNPIYPLEKRFDYLSAKRVHGRGRGVLLSSEERISKEQNGRINLEHNGSGT